MPLPQMEDAIDTNMSVGEILRRTREHYGRSLEEVEKSLHIRQSQITAIEENDTEALPGRVYAIGFVRSYAEYLGLDGDKIVKLFKKQVNVKARPQVYDFPVPAKDGKLPSIPLVLVSSALVVGILVASWIFFTRDRGPSSQVPTVAEAKLESDAMEEALQSDLQDPVYNDGPAEVFGPPVPPMLDTQVIQVETGEVTVSRVSQNTAANTPAPSVSVVDTTVILNMVQDVQIDIRDQNGTPVLSRVLPAGESYFIPNRPDLQLSVGNAGAVQIEINGKNMGAMGRQGEVKSNLPLDLNAISAQYTATQPVPGSAP